VKTVPLVEGIGHHNRMAVFL